MFFGVTKLDLRSEVDGFSAWIGSIDSRADIDTRSTTSAILGCNLYGDFETSHFLAFCVGALKGGRRILEYRRIISFHADYSMRADQAAIATLSAKRWLPYRNFLRYIALFVLRCAGRKGSIEWQLRNRHFLTALRNNLAQSFPHKLGSRLWHRREHVLNAVCLANLDLMRGIKCQIYCIEILLDDIGAFSQISLLCVLLDEFDSLLLGQYARDLEECGLHNGVDSRAHSSLVCDGHSVDYIEA